MAALEALTRSLAPIVVVCAATLAGCGGGRSDVDTRAPTPQRMPGVTDEMAGEFCASEYDKLSKAKPTTTIHSVSSVITGNADDGWDVSSSSDGQSYRCVVHVVNGKLTLVLLEDQPERDFAPGDGELPGTTPSVAD